MSPNQWERIRSGCIGTFQPLASPPLSPPPGMIKLTDEHVEVTFMAGEDRLNERMLPAECRAIFGETEVGDVLILSIAQRSGSWGGFSPRHGTDRGASCLIPQRRRSMTTLLLRLSFTITDSLDGLASDA
jgi:hypothetical protein